MGQIEENTTSQMKTDNAGNLKKSGILRLSLIIPLLTQYDIQFPGL